MKLRKLKLVSAFGFRHFCFCKRGKVESGEWFLFSRFLRGVCQQNKYAISRSRAKRKCACELTGTKCAQKKLKAEMCSPRGIGDSPSGIAASIPPGKGLFHRGTVEMGRPR